MKSTRVKHRSLIENHKRKMEDKEKENLSKCKQLIKKVANQLPPGNQESQEAINIEKSEVT
jgi:hypothetical protein